VHRTEVNSHKFTAKRLGISEEEFEDSLTTEINELLEEIEKTRLGSLESTDEGITTTTLPVRESGSSSKEPCSTTGEAQKDRSEQSKQYENPHTNGDRSPKGLKDSARATGRHVSRKKAKCTFGPGKQRGRGRVRTSPSRRDASPPPPLCRTSSPSVDDG
jgi:hypothetical protein